ARTVFLGKTHLSPQWPAHSARAAPTNPLSPQNQTSRRYGAEQHPRAEGITAYVSSALATACESTGTPGVGSLPRTHGRLFIRYEVASAICTSECELDAFQTACPSSPCLYVHLRAARTEHETASRSSVAT